MFCFATVIPIKDFVISLRCRISLIQTHLKQKRVISLQRHNWQCENTAKSCPRACLQMETPSCSCSEWGFSLGRVNFCAWQWVRGGWAERSGVPQAGAVLPRCQSWFWFLNLRPLTWGVIPAAQWRQCPVQWHTEPREQSRLGEGQREAQMCSSICSVLVVYGRLLI